MSSTRDGLLLHIPTLIDGIFFCSYVFNYCDTIDLQCLLCEMLIVLTVRLLNIGQKKHCS